MTTATRTKRPEPDTSHRDALEAWERVKELIRDEDLLLAHYRLGTDSTSIYTTGVYDGVTWKATLGLLRREIEARYLEPIARGDVRTTASLHARVYDANTSERWYDDKWQDSLKTPGDDKE